MLISSRRKAAGLRLVPCWIPVLLTATMLAACGHSGSAAQKHDVASLASGAPLGDESATAPSDAGRPQLRLDSTDEESTRLWIAYKGCLKEHGATDVDTGTAAGAAAPDGSGVVSTNKTAVNACAKREPLGPPELDPAKNPNFNSQFNHYVQCERKNGVMMHVTSPGREEWDSNADPNVDVANWERVSEDCTLKSFGAGK